MVAGSFSGSSGVLDHSLLDSGVFGFIYKYVKKTNVNFPKLNIYCLMDPDLEKLFTKNVVSVQTIAKGT